MQERNSKMIKTSLKVSNHRIITLVMFVFCFVLVFDPTDKMFHAKELISVFLVLLIPLELKTSPYSKNVLFFFYFCIIMILYSFFAGIFSGLKVDDHFYFGFAKSFFVFFILSFFSYREFEKPFFISLILLIILSLLIYVYAVYDYRSVAKLITYLFHDVGNALIGKRTYGDWTIFMVYYKTISLVILLIGYLLSKKSYTLAFLSIIALFVSGTRANMFAALSIPAVYFFLNANKKMKIILGIGFVCGGVIIILPFISNVLLSPTEASNSVKIGHFNSYMNLFESFPSFFIFGSGAGTSFYSTGNNKFDLNTELVLFDIIRYVGIFFTLFFYTFLLLPLRRMIKLDKTIAFSYFMYILVATTNPLLISSTGFLAISFGYLYAYKNTKGNINATN